MKQAPFPAGYIDNWYIWIILILSLSFLFPIPSSDWWNHTLCSVSLFQVWSTSKVAHILLEHRTWYLFKAFLNFGNAANFCRRSSEIGGMKVEVVGFGNFARSNPILFLALIARSGAWVFYRISIESKTRGVLSRWVGYGRKYINILHYFIVYYFYPPADWLFWAGSWTLTGIILTKKAEGTSFPQVSATSFGGFAVVVEKYSFLFGEIWSAFEGLYKATVITRLWVAQRDPASSDRPIRKLLSRALRSIFRFAQLFQGTYFSFKVLQNRLINSGTIWLRCCTRTVVYCFGKREYYGLLNKKSVLWRCRLQIWKLSDMLLSLPPLTLKGLFFPFTPAFFCRRLGTATYGGFHDGSWLRQATSRG